MRILDGPPTEMIGRHSVWIDEEALLIRYDGEIRLEHARRLMDLVNAVRKRHGGMFLIADLQRGGIMEPAARRYIADHLPADQQGFMFGVHAAQRILISMMQRAMALLGKTAPHINFCDSEQSALVELEAARARFRATRSMSNKES